MCIYESLGTQAYLSLQPNVCQHRSPKYIGPGQLYIISIIKSQHIVFWTQCVDGYKDGYNTMMTQFNYTHWSYNICWHEIASHLMPFNNIYHTWWSNQSWCKLTYLKNSKTLNLSWHTCMKHSMGERSQHTPYDFKYTWVMQVSILNAIQLSHGWCKLTYLHEACHG